MKTFAVALLLVSCLWGHSAAVNDLDEFDNQMSSFYLSPSENAFQIFQKRAIQFQNKLEGSKNGADLLVAVMIARASQTYGWPIADSVFGDKAKEIIAGKSPLAMYVSDDSRVDPTKLDIWWASFLATGDTLFLEKIFVYVGHELPKDNINKMLVIGAATWSFKSNCKQHKKVLEFAKIKLGLVSISESQRKFLKECIAYAESGNSN